MPVMNTKIEGRGNGIKTVIPNIEDVARALARPPTCMSAFTPNFEALTNGNRPHQVLWLRARSSDDHG
jgi:hypothetical protein